MQDRTGASLGPISLSFAESVDSEADMTDAELADLVQQERQKYQSTNRMSTEEWRSKFEQEGAVDLWVEEEFNSGSRIKVLYFCLWPLRMRCTALTARCCVHLSSSQHTATI